MKALSVKACWAGLIREGLKTLEIRSRPTNHRGPLLICTSKQPRYDSVPCGAALCIVQVVACRPMVPADEAAAGCAYAPGLYAWELQGATPVEPVPVTGRLGFFEVPDALLTRADGRAA